MKYIVEVVEEGALPEGVQTIIIERDDAPPLLMVSGEVARAWSAMRAWEDTIEPSWQPTVTLPGRHLRAVS
jgi:hypothetical protein